MAGGAKFGYLLLWVILMANLMAMLIQSMSAKLGIATGMNLPEVCRERFPRTVDVRLWIQAEVIAMATDLAEFIGAAIGLNLLFGIPLFPAGADHGRRRVRDPRAAGARLPAPRGGDRGLIGVIVVAFASQVVLADPTPRTSRAGSDPAASRARRACCSRSGSSARP